MRLEPGDVEPWMPGSIEWCPEDGSATGDGLGNWRCDVCGLTWPRDAERRPRHAIVAQERFGTWKLYEPPSRVVPEPRERPQVQKGRTEGRGPTDLVPPSKTPAPRAVPEPQDDRPVAWFVRNHYGEFVAPVLFQRDPPELDPSSGWTSEPLFARPVAPTEPAEATEAASQDPVEWGN